MVYKITTPTGYTGIIAGVSFVNGEAETEDNWLGSWFKEKGYEVESIEDTEEIVEVADNEEEQDSLSDLTLKELKNLAKEKGVEGYSNLNKKEIIEVLGE